MNYFAILKGRTRSMMMDVLSLAIIVVAVILSVLISKGSFIHADPVVSVVVVNEDNGYLGERYAKILLHEKGFSFREADYEEAMELLAKNKAHGVAVITPEFTEKIQNGDYESLIDLTVMSDNQDMNAFSELVINDAVKIWTEVMAEKELTEVAGADETEIASFREQSSEVWDGGSLLNVVPYMTEETVVDVDANSDYGIRWYAALAMFYLIISGTWMCDYAGTGLLKRAKRQGSSIAALFLVQSLPGLAVTALGFLPVLLCSESERPVQIFVSFLFYLFATAGLALTVCSIAGRFSNLVLVAPLITMAASLISGLLCKLPDWARAWDILSAAFPGHWFQNAVTEQPFFLGAIVIAAAWFALGIFTSWVFGLRKQH